MSPVEQLKKKLARRKLRGLALDIDETLASTDDYWLDHMLHHHPVDGLNRQEIIRQQMFVEDVPQWSTPEARASINRMLHSNEFQEELPLIAGADDGVRHVHAVTPIVAYITARPATVRAGTERWLRKHGFPDAALILREGLVSAESDSHNRNRWKIGVLKALWPEVTGIVDDNMGLAHELESTGYEGIVYLYGPQHDVFKGHPRVVVCPTWDDVVAAVISRS